MAIEKHQIQRAIFLVLFVMILLGGYYSLKSNSQKETVEDNVLQPTASTIPVDTKLVTINTHSYVVELAKTPEERQKGLSGRQTLASGAGMLFVFEQPGQHGFWMKDTLIPLDIIWIGADKRIVHIEKNVLPSSYPTTLQPENDALYVLEVNAKEAQKNLFKIGDEVSFSTAE